MVLFSLLICHVWIVSPNLNLIQWVSSKNKYAICCWSHILCVFLTLGLLGCFSNCLIHGYYFGNSSDELPKLLPLVLYHKKSTPCSKGWIIFQPSDKVYNNTLLIWNFCYISEMFFCFPS